MLEVWRGWADDVRGGPIDTGPFVPEDDPAAVVAALVDFLDN